MRPKDPVNWMLSDAIETLARAERMHQRFLNLHPLTESREPSWEPPMDVIETDDEILIFIALPGVDPADVQTALDGATLVISGRRALPPELRNARILRLELPQGRFERRIQLPTGRYTINRFAAHGCVGLRLGKSS
ncbi:Hsp20/alpha crystallin family protein [Bradyrhizobium sp. WSM 1704]|uniref:Hsp20/alpha crystallin family protein n=1 Tax=Bradyrhizobium semiaridum TaxID=2821404 RepID=UPI001CE2A36B|nr:Hsp20/alpha crystallin family protein [Bradyrhizobium semiaridum]MCA6126301.1 Hsp20/alpha crystallin family protein [Bradyrhizobium semiaridum]